MSHRSFSPLAGRRCGEAADEGRHSGKHAPLTRRFAPPSPRKRGEGSQTARFAIAHPTIARIIAKSAIASGESVGIDAPTVVVTLAELFDGVGSGVVEAIVTVFDVDVPAGVLSGTLNVNWNVALAPLANEAMVQTIGPVPLQLNAGPVVWFAETKVMPAGTVSVSVTLAAFDGPAFAAVTL